MKDNKDRDEVLAAVKQNGYALGDADESFKKDREIVMAAVKQCGFALQYADESFRKDREVVLVALNQAGCALQYADESFRKDREVVLKAVKQNGGALSYADESFRKDKEIVLAAVKKNGLALDDADKSLKKDREVVLAAVKQDGNAIRYAAKSILKDREIVLAALKQNVLALNYADKSLLKDKEFVMAAVKNDGGALSYADESFRKDKEIVMAAVNQDAEALDYADESLKKDKDIIQLTLKQNDSEESLSYTLVGEELTYHSEIISKADLSSVEKIKKQIDDFIKNSDSSSSSYPVIGFMENPEGSKLSEIYSTLEDSKNNIIEYKINNNGPLIDKPKKGEITFIYYYQYLSSLYNLVPLASHKNVSFEINIFNNEAVISNEQKQFEFECEDADKGTETSLQILFDDGKNIEDTIDNKNNLITQINDYLAE